MDWNTSGDYRKYAPVELRELPLELQRSHLYPRDPDAVVDAAQDYLDGKPKPTYLPQQMAFTRHMTPPWKVAWLGSTVALLAAKQREQARLQALEAAGQYNVPVKTMGEQAQEIKQMPRPMDEVNPEIQMPVAAQGLTNARLSSDDLTQFIKRHQQRIEKLGQLKVNAKATAIEEIQSQMADHSRMTSIRQDSPWFLRGLRR